MRSSICFWMTLGVVIQYFGANKRTLVSTFLGLVELEAGDAKSIAKAIVDYLEKCNLKKENIQGIGTDDASVMTGVHNGVRKILNEECALLNLVLICCMCHSLQLTGSAASKETIRRCVVYLIRETYNWFSIYSKRREAYKAVYATINCGQKPRRSPKYVPHVDYRLSLR